ncbi:MAG: response regulator [Pyrinomonadaceae bacterium]|nr:response regulator [Pyrinomonadaceae bacterium]
MMLAETLLEQLNDPALSHDERVRLRCRVAADFEHRGQYEAARDALAGVWRGVGQQPDLEGLSERTVAEVLLRVGTLSSCFGTNQQVEGVQEAAKDLISGSVTRFQALGETTRAAAAQSDLALCYWREGAFDEARVVYVGALEELRDQDPELRARISIRLTMVEFSSGRLNNALRILTDNAPVVEVSENHALKGSFHNQLGCVLMFLGKDERRPDYVDRSILEYTAATFHFEEAGHTSYRARAENNLGFLLYTIGRYDEAHRHLERARRLFVGPKNVGNVAQVDETRARVLLAEGRAREAAKVISSAVQTLSRGGEQGLLAEALTTQGRVLARLGDVSESQNKLRSAADLAQQAGAVDGAGRALLALIEEHADRLTVAELLEAYDRADNLLKDTQDAEIVARLRACAGRLVAAHRAVTPASKQSRSITDFWANFSLPKKVHAFEARYIERALRDAQGSVSRAARLLGFKHHALLASLLRGKHKKLASLRTPPGKRRRSILRGIGQSKAAKDLQLITILYVEDDRIVAGTVKETLELEGCRVKLSGDGTDALKKLESNAHYDLLIFDNDLPGTNGIDLVRYARRLPHRRLAPIIMLTAGDVEAEASHAGVDAFLRKPEDIRTLVETTARLLNIDPR